MVRKYEITEPSRCRNCDKRDNCEFLEKIQQAPFDSFGVVLDCKSFYYTFCELEKTKESYRHSIDSNDVNDEGISTKPFLDPALVVNGVLAAELALKALILEETGLFDCIHDLEKLFNALPEPHKTALTDRLKAGAHQNDATLCANLRIIKDFFVEWRYFFVKEALGYSGFLLSFVHIVCDYVIDEVTVSGKTD